MKSSAEPRSLIIRTLIPIGVLFAAFLLVALNVHLEEVRVALASISLEAIGLMLCATTFNLLARSVRWFLLYRCASPENAGSLLKSAPRQFLIYIGGYAFTLTPGRAGEAIRVWMAHRSFRTAIPEGLSLVVADRFYDAVALTLILVVTAVMLAKEPLIVAAMIIVLTASVFVLGWSSSASAFWRRAVQIAPRLSGAIEGLRRTISQLAIVTRPRRFPVFVLPSLAGWLVQGLVPVVVLGDMGISLSLENALFVYAMATLIGGASLLPGGLGGFEASMIGLLSILDVPIATAVAATLIIRLTTLWFGVLLGLSMLAVWTFVARESSPLCRRTM
jgi:glycosyltransferase 2 family protein